MDRGIVGVDEPTGNGRVVLAADLVADLDAFECVVFRREECESLPQFFEGGRLNKALVERDVGGIVEGVSDGEFHVGRGDVGEDRTVGELDHAVNLALWVDGHIDVIVIEAEKMVRFDDFEPFVDPGGGVDGDFGAHVPRGVGQGVFCGNRGEFLRSFVEEGAAGTG